MPYDLEHLSLSEMTQCGARLRRLGQDASSMEEAADRVARFLRDELAGQDGPACPLVRVYKTHAQGDLPADLQAFATAASGAPVPPATRCLTLLATAGAEAAWNDRRQSRSHQAIPLPSPEAVRQLPMVLQLVQQLGLDPVELLAAGPELMVDAGQRTFNVFYVPQAVGSPHIPAQDFVADHGIVSVLGFGGLLPPADLFAVILFARVPISQEVAELFKPLSLSARMALLPFAGGQTFRAA